MNRLISLFVSIFIIVSLFSCSSRKTAKEEVVPDYSFSNYISNYTSGEISVQHPIIITLVKGNVQFNHLNAGLEDGIIQIKPEVKGKISWIDKNTIQFHPDEWLKADQNYTVEFNLAKVQNVPKKYRKFIFSFKTIKPAFSVNQEGLSSRGGMDMKLMNYRGNIVTSDATSLEDVQKLLEAKIGSNKQKIVWTQSSDQRTHTFVIDSINREENNSQVLKLKWNGKAVGVDKKGEEEIEIPKPNNFYPLETKVISRPSQHVEIRFSDPVNVQQDLQGLITIENETNLKISVEGNTVHLWPERQIVGERTITIYPGIKNSLGLKLQAKEERKLRFLSIKPAVKLIGKGVIVPHDGQLMMPFKAVSLNAVELRIIQVYSKNILQFFQDNRVSGDDNLKRVGRMVYMGSVELKPDSPEDLLSWGTYKINVGDYIELEEGAIYKIEIRFKKEYSLYDCAETSTKRAEAESNFMEAMEREKEMATWDRPGWYNDYYWPHNYNWEERNDPCSESYYNSDHFVSRNIMASNLGIIAKEGKGNNMFFAVTDLRTTDPVADAKLQILNYQGQVISEISTNSDGFANVDLDQKAFLLVVKKGNDTGYLRLDDGASLSMSNFNVSGKSVQSGLKGFIYGERGVWRPGDHMYLNFILFDKLGDYPIEQPVIFKLFNPKGQVVEKRISNDQLNGFYHFNVKTADDAPTGNWRVEVQAGSSRFTKSVKIETVKPNRLKINLKLPELIYTDKKEDIPLSVQWLHGAPAKSLNTVIDLLLQSKKTVFKDYEAYEFTDPASNFNPKKTEFFKGKVDEHGEGSVPLNFESLESAPGMLNAYFTIRVFEEGGDFSTNVQKSEVSPYRRYVGIKMPTNKSRWFKLNTKYMPEIVVLDAEGKPARTEDVKIELYKIDWRWWWESGDDYLARYVNGHYTRPVKKWELKDVNEKQKFDLEVKYERWEDSGRYLLRATDTKSGHSAGLTFYMSEWGGWRPSGSEGATMLSIQSDKESYTVGETVKMSIPSSKKGKALVSLENGEGIKDIFWVKTNDKETKFEFPVKKGMAPNIFVHISLIQEYGQTEKRCAT